LGPAFNVGKDGSRQDPTWVSPVISSFVLQDGGSTSGKTHGGWTWKPRQTGSTSDRRKLRKKGLNCHRSCQVSKKEG
jgi:hypothetical protein